MAYALTLLQHRRQLRGTRQSGTIEESGGNEMMIGKNSNLFKAVRSSLLCSTLLLMLSIPAAAQNNNARTDNANTTTTTTRTENREERRDDDRDWGWLGLLGLAGLLGLMPRKRVAVVQETRDMRPGTTDHM